MEEYAKVYGGKEPCRMSELTVANLKSSLAALSFDDDRTELVIELSEDNWRKRALDLGVDYKGHYARPYYYIFGYCSGTTIKRPDLPAWIPFRLFNLVQAGHGSPVNLPPSKSAMLITDPLLEPSHILLFDDYGVLVQTRRDAGELDALAKVFYNAARR